MQCATWTQNTVNLSCRAGFHVVVQVVQHHRRQHPIELAIGERELLRVCALEPDTGHSTRFSLCPGKRQRIGIGTDHVRARFSALDSGRDVARAAADFQDAEASSNFGLRDERVVDPVHAEQESQQVVSRKQRVAAGGGYVIVLSSEMWMMFGHRSHGCPLLHTDVG